MWARYYSVQSQSFLLGENKVFRHNLKKNSGVTAYFQKDFVCLSGVRRGGGGSVVVYGPTEFKFPVVLKGKEFQNVWNVSAVLQGDRFGCGCVFLKKN